MYAETMFENKTGLVFKYDVLELSGLVIKRRSPGPVVTKLFSCSTQLRLKLILLINVKMPTIVGILTFMRRKNY